MTPGIQYQAIKSISLEEWLISKANSGVSLRVASGKDTDLEIFMIYEVDTQQTKGEMLIFSETPKPKTAPPPPAYNNAKRRSNELF